MSDDQFQILITQMSALNDKFDALNSKFDTLSSRVDILEQRFDTLEQRFDILERRFDTLENRVDVLSKQTTKQIGDLNEALLKLYHYMEQRFDKVEAALADKADRKDVDHLYSTLDTLLKNQETDQQERLAMMNQLSRHESWHHKAAQKLGIRLDYNTAS